MAASSKTGPKIGNRFRCGVVVAGMPVARLGARAIAAKNLVVGCLAQHLCDPRVTGCLENLPVRYSMTEI